MIKKDIEKIIQDCMEDVMKGIGKDFVYYNEQQFQFDLANRLKLKCPQYDVIFEAKTNDKVADCAYIDLTIYDKIDSSYYCVELKYKKSNKHTYKTKYGTIQLANDGAQDIGRYLFLYDVSRVEKLSNGTLKSIQYDRNYKKCIGGCAMILTNDDAYFNCPNRTKSLPMYYEFRIRTGDDKKAHSKYAWACGSSALGKKGLKNPIEFDFDHEIVWSSECNHFKYLIVYNDR